MKTRFYSDNAAPCYRCGGTIAGYTVDDVTSMVDVLCAGCHRPDVFSRNTNAPVPETAAQVSEAHRNQGRRELYNVVQFFVDGSHEYVRRHVPAQEAVEAAYHYCHSVGARFGVTVKVIITDAGDCTNFVWERGKGVTFK